PRQRPESAVRPTETLRETIMSDDHHGTIRYEDSGIPQPWHLVRPSIWPLIGAIAAGLMMLGAGLFMHKDKINLAGGSDGFGPFRPAARPHRRAAGDVFLGARHRPRNRGREGAFAFGVDRTALRHAAVHRVGGHVLHGVLLGLFQRPLFPARHSWRCLAAAEY